MRKCQNFLTAIRINKIQMFPFFAVLWKKVKLLGIQGFDNVKVNIVAFVENRKHNYGG